MEYLTIALAKGRLAEISIELLEQCGIDCSALKVDTRKLVLSDEVNKVKFLLVKPSDVPVYVDYGVADIGIIGKDTLMEENRPLYEVLDLGFATCKLSIAGYPHTDIYNRSKAIRVGTKYPRIAENFFQAKGMAIEIIPLHGSVELAPITGLADVILDIVESGKTLRANGLDVLEDVCNVSARLVVNQVSLKTQSGRIRELVTRLSRLTEGKSND